MHLENDTVCEHCGRTNNDGLFWLDGDRVCRWCFMKAEIKHELEEEEGERNETRDYNM